MIARKRVQVFKPVLDDRYSPDEIVSHGDIRIEIRSGPGCRRDSSPSWDWRSDVIGIDEANFLGSDLIEVATRLADSGKQVILSDWIPTIWAAVPADSGAAVPGRNHHQKRWRSVCAAAIQPSTRSGWWPPKS